MEKNTEAKINNMIQELENQLKEIKKMVEEKEGNIYEASLSEIKDARENIENIDIELYKRRIKGVGS